MIEFTDFSETKQIKTPPSFTKPGTMMIVHGGREAWTFLNVIEGWVRYYLPQEYDISTAEYVGEYD